MLHGKALITGASGFIGGQLRARLLRDGLDVVALRRRGSPEPKAGRSSVAEYDDVDALRRLVAAERPDYVFHVAGSTKGVTYEDFQHANVVPTRNLLAALRDAHPDVRRFVLVSSLTSYGPSSPERPHEESDPRRPIEFYGQSKLEAERIVESNDRIPWSIVRPGGVFGPGDVDYFELFRTTARGINLFYGNRHRWMSVIFVDDCVQGIVDAAAQEVAQGEGYFLTDGRPITWDDFQAHIVRHRGGRTLTIDLPEALVGVAATAGELLTKMDGKPRLINRQKARMGAQRAWLASSAKAEAELGFRARIDVPRAVELTDTWYRENRWY